MKKPNSNLRRGSGLVVIIILVCVIGGIYWWLWNTKKQSDHDARVFGREIINRLTVQHDLSFFRNNLSPQARLDMPPSVQQGMIEKLTSMGVPAQPIKIEENITFESTFFSPRGIFTADLNYPEGPAQLQLAVSHPVGKWQVDNLTLIWSKPPTNKP